jgi:hypothetical protein
MTIAKFLLILFLMGVLTFLIGIGIVKRQKQNDDFMESVIFMRELIRSSELSETAYHNILEAFRDFDLTCRNRQTYRKLFTEFMFRYKDFLPENYKIK